MLRFRLLVLFAVSSSLVACGAIPDGKTPNEGSAYSTSSSSSSVGSIGSFSSGSLASPSGDGGGAVTPHAVETASNLLVKPDEARVCFTLRAQTTDAPKALDDFRGLAGEMERRFKETVAKEARLVMKNVSVSPEEANSKKSSDPTKPKVFTVVATGVVELALPENAPYWERARLVGSASQLAATLSAMYNDTPVRAIVTRPELRVKAPEAHRKALLEKWVKKSQELSKTAKIGGRTLDFTSCSPPGDVQQRLLSVEEAELTLPVSCEPLRASVDKSDGNEKSAK